jgi:hypothetical protein
VKEQLSEFPGCPPPEALTLVFAGRVLQAPAPPARPPAPTRSLLRGTRSALSSPRWSNQRLRRAADRARARGSGGGTAHRGARAGGALGAEPALAARVQHPEAVDAAAPPAAAAPRHRAAGGGVRAARGRARRLPGHLRHRHQVATPPAPRPCTRNPPPLSAVYHSERDAGRTKTRSEEGARARRRAGARRRRGMPFEPLAVSAGSTRQRRSRRWAPPPARRSRARRSFPPSSHRTWRPRPPHGRSLFVRTWRPRRPRLPTSGPRDGGGGGSSGSGMAGRDGGAVAGAAAVLVAGGGGRGCLPTPRLPPEADPSLPPPRRRPLRPPEGTRRAGADRRGSGDGELRPPPFPLVLSGHAASLTPYQSDTPRPSSRANRTRLGELRARGPTARRRALPRLHQPRGLAALRGHAAGSAAGRRRACRWRASLVLFHGARPPGPPSGANHHPAAPTTTPRRQSPPLEPFGTWMAPTNILRCHSRPRRATRPAPPAAG